MQQDMHEPTYEELVARLAELKQRVIILERYLRDFIEYNGEKKEFVERANHLLSLSHDWQPPKPGLKSDVS